MRTLDGCGKCRATDNPKHASRVPQIKTFNHERRLVFIKAHIWISTQCQTGQVERSLIMDSNLAWIGEIQMEFLDFPPSV